MQNMTDSNAKIKSSLREKTDELIEFIATAVRDGTSVHDVEKGLWLKIIALGYHAMKLYFTSLGDGNAGEQVILANGQQVKRLEKPRIKQYLTVFGEFEIPRVVYGTREGQAIEFIPLDTRIQFPASKFSYLLQDWDQSLAVEMPFGKVNQTLSKILGFEQSVNSLERTDRHLSESVNSFWDEAQTPPAEEEGAILVTTADGKGVVMRHSEVEQKNKDTTRPGTKKMSLVGSVYTVDPYVRTPETVLSALFHDPRDANDLPSRPNPCHKHVRAALLRNEKGKTEPQTEAIFGWMADEVKQRDPHHQKPLVLLRDGQESQWNAGRAHLPKDTFTLVEILDLIHVASYVWAAAHLFFPRKSKSAEAYVRRQIERILNNEVKGVIKTLKRKGRYEKLKGKALTELETICGYFTHNADRMKYKDYLEQGFPIASGVIEGACRNVVKDRMEQSGMRWVMAGAHAMLSLRSIHLSGLWDEFIQFRIERETERLYPDQAANDEFMFLNRVA